MLINFVVFHHTRPKMKSKDSILILSMIIMIWKNGLHQTRTLSISIYIGQDSAVYVLYSVLVHRQFQLSIAIVSLVKSLKVCPSPFAMLIRFRTFFIIILEEYYANNHNIRLITIISIPAPIGVVMTVTTPSESPLIMLGAMKKEYELSSNRKYCYNVATPRK
jgi:hypothetical protein